MVKIVSMAEAYTSFDDLLDGIDSTKEPVIVQKDGKTLAVFISTEAFAEMQKLGERNTDHGPHKTIPVATDTDLG